MGLVCAPIFSLLFYDFMFIYFFILGLFCVARAAFFCCELISSISVFIFCKIETNSFWTVNPGRAPEHGDHPEAALRQLLKAGSPYGEGLAGGAVV